MNHRASNIVTLGLSLLLLALVSPSRGHDAAAGSADEGLMDGGTSPPIPARGPGPGDLDIGESLAEKGSTLREGSIRMASRSDLPFKGVDYWQHAPFDHPDSDLSLAIVESMGANWISAWVFACQDSLNSTTVYTCPYTASDAALIHLIDQAHGLGLQVMFKLGVEAAPSVGSEFDDAAWADWFASYRQFANRYAGFAKANSADLFVVGNELRHAVPQEAQWRQTIAGVRARFHGPITYSSLCYGEESENQWWDALDYIGINFYRSLTGQDDPSLAELKDAWIPHVAQLADLASRWGKAILFTEIGFCSRDGGNHDCELLPDPQLDLHEQTDCFQAAFESLDGEPWFAGMFWHQWASDPFHGGPCDDFYYFHDKPAEDVVRAWFGGSPRSEPEPDYSQSAAIYTDGLAPGWEDGAWSATYTLTATDQVYTGTRAISVTLEPWGGIQFRYPSFDTSPYHFLEFYIRTAAPREQQLWAVFHQDGPDMRPRPLDAWGRYVKDCVIEPGVWKRIRIPLWHLDAADRSITVMNIFEGSGQASASFWLDEIRLVGRKQHSGCLPRYSEPQFILRVRDADSYEPELEVGDFNGDGLNDVVIRRSQFGATTTFDLDILLNDGNGSLVLGTSSVFSGTVPRVQAPAPMILVADFNGDERPDIFVPDGGMDTEPFPGYQNTLVLSVPGGRLVDATANLPQQNDLTHSAAAGDIDGDGDNDLYLGNFWAQNMIDPQILINDGSGEFTVAEDRLHESLDLTQNGYTASELVDVDNDGFPDLVLGDAGDDIDNEYSTPDSVVLLNDGLGSFTSPPISLPAKPFTVTDIGLDIQPADLNDDGYQDLLIAYTKGNPWYVGRYVQVLINNQDGTFHDETGTRLPQSDNDDPYIYRLQLMDMDRDQDMDVIARPWDDQDPDPLLFLNDGRGHFSQHPLDFGLPYLYYTFLDLDGDGGHDLVFDTAAPPEDVYAIRDLGCPVFLPFVCRTHPAAN